MQKILNLFVHLDTYARDTYLAMAQSASNPALTRVFEQMAAEEATHLEWWAELVNAWGQGLIPDLVTESADLDVRLAALLEELVGSTPSDVSALSDDEMLQTATRLEYYMLDPVFTEVIDLAGPSSAAQHREAYQRHVDRLVGAVEELYSPDPLASFLARILREAWRQNQELSSFATRDPLTALHNRRGLMAHFSQWASWAERYDRPISVLLIDVDDFKNVNDTCGHTAGDTVLVAVANVLRGALRGSDMVARYGGDEFAIVAPETAGDQIEPITSRILERVAALTIGCDQVPSVTVSIGCAWTSGPNASRATDALLSAADRSLYDAKHKGKNRVGDVIAL